MTPAIDVPPKDLKTLNALLKEHLPGIAVWAYGSRVKWTSRPDSDLDMVAFAPPERLAGVAALRTACEESSLPFRVDLFVWDEVPEKFRKNIETEHAVLQEGGGGADEWRTIQIGDLGRVVTGKTPLTKTHEHFGGTIPFITPSDMDDRRIISHTVRYLTEQGAASVPGARIPGGAIMVSCIGSDMGKVAIAGCDAVTNQQINSIVVSDGISNLYVYYNLSLRQVEIRNLGSAGSAVPILNKTHFSQLQIAIPPLPKQRAIAGVLGALDDKIEQNRRTGRALEKLAQAIFRAWFVDFEPVKWKMQMQRKGAKAQGRKGKAVNEPFASSRPGDLAFIPQGATSFPGMPQEVFDALPTRFVDSEIGPVPEGWEVGKLGDHCEINQCNLRAGEIEGEIEYVDISSVTVGRLTGIQRVLFSEAPSRARRRVRHGDTIWSCVRPNHRSYLFVHSPPESRIVSTGFAVLTPAGFGASLLYEITTQPEFVDFLVSNADGSAYPAVRPDHFAAAEVVVPPPPFRDAYEEITTPLRDLFAAVERESTTLAEVRDYLLAKLLSGAVRVGTGAGVAMNKHGKHGRKGSGREPLIQKHGGYRVRRQHRSAP